MQNCDALEKPPATYESAILPDPDSRDGEGRRIILVTPRGDERFYRGRIHHTFSFADAASRAEPGTTLHLLPGKYYRAVDLSGKRGEPDKPIIIEGAVDGDGRPLAHICGTNAAGSIYPDLPDRHDYAFIKLRRCRYIVIRHLQIESCWPSFIYAEGTHHLTVEHISGQDGSYLAFIRGPGAHTIAMRHCTWEQDPTGTLWSAIGWKATHHGAYAYYNGALLGGIDVHGDIEVAGNTVINAFNGVRFTTSSKDPEHIRGRFNVNARIHHNRFDNIRDNVFEPEETLLNWHIHDNLVRNTHAPFSIHDFHGGYLYIYNNRIWFDARGGSDYQTNRGGKIYKFRPLGPMPDRPIHVFHNSLYSRTFLIKKAQVRNFIHRNNAVQFCTPEHHPECLCQAGRRFLKKFPMTIRDDKEVMLPWDESVIFDWDASSTPFGKELKTQEKNGVREDDLGFVDPRKGDFTLTPHSPLRAAGLAFTLAPEKDLPKGQAAWQNWPGGGQPCIGAHQDHGQIELPYQPIEDVARA